jgi:hypothetical protein
VAGRRTRVFNGDVSDFIYLVVTFVAFGLLAVLVGILDRRLSK